MELSEVIVFVCYLLFMLGILMYRKYDTEFLYYI